MHLFVILIEAIPIAVKVLPIDGYKAIDSKGIAQPKGAMESSVVGYDGFYMQLREVSAIFVVKPKVCIAYEVL